ncbi:cell division protein FtsX [Desulfovibrio ferrophilus]|uniref:Cell division protein FtsX n=1 Tax=Desulfovibrio ferrophilus TaxID=241368 RepID=A0A2Z6B1M9_9BACT|nr:FtsX-like permease family protein [Desulfovibrio ferrophilus]BBD09363.1 cell division protein FtsX [Desulfovibrio ferrophilus]
MGMLMRLIVRGFSDLTRNPLAQVMTLMAVTLTAFLAGLFLLFVVNLNQELSSAKGRFVFQVYWQADADMAVVKKQWQEFQTLDGLLSMKTFTPDEALADLARSLEGGETQIKGLTGDSPLPATAVLHFASPAGDPEAFTQNILSRIAGKRFVQDVHYSTMQLGLAKAWKSFARTVLWPLIACLGLVGALIVSNTLRLSLISRRDEVEILQLVGAGRWYIQLPLVVGGATLGLVGGVLSLGMLKGVQLALADLFNTPPLNLSISFLPVEYAVGLAVGMALVGAASSLMALRQ